MNITLIGTGCGDLSTITAGAVSALRRADLIIGAGRLLESMPAQWTGRRESAIRPEEILQIIRRAQEEAGGPLRVCVIYSGDTGFYSGSRTLTPLLEEAGYEFQVLPGISSVQMMAARLARPWQDWRLVSAHGQDCDAPAEVSRGSAVFFLTGGRLGPADLCRQLTEAGLGDLSVTVGERLSYPEERISRGSAAEFADRSFDPLSVMLAEAAPERAQLRPGIPDGMFIRGEVPMTKQDVRAVIAGRMQAGEDDVIWDVGAGTGSVSVELALQAKAGQVFAIERDPCGILLIRQNRERFGVWNLHPVEGEAPEVLEHLPAPDAVFVGGSGGHMAQILDAALEKNPAVRVCVSAILLETVTETLSAMAARGMQTDLVQAAFSTARKAGKKHMMIGGNPIYVITGARQAQAEGQEADR